MKNVVKKIIQIIVFFIIFTIIVLSNFVIYKNIDKIIPTAQGEVYIFDNNLKQEKYNFLYDMYIEIEEQKDYRRILHSSTLAEENSTVFNIIKKYTFFETIIEEKLEIPLYSGELQNTVYGNLKFLVSKTYTDKKGYAYTNFYIVYSEDMKKICFYNLKGIGVEPNDYSIQVKDETYYDENYKSNGSAVGKIEDTDSELNQIEAVKNKEEIIKKVKEKFSEVITNIELKPNTIIKKSYSYILQDEENDITIYYDNENNDIFGFHMGFGN